MPIWGMDQSSEQLDNTILEIRINAAQSTSGAHQTHSTNKQKKTVLRS